MSTKNAIIKQCNVAIFLEHHRDEGTIETLMRLLPYLKSKGFKKIILEDTIVLKGVTELDEIVKIEQKDQQEISQGLTALVAQKSWWQWLFDPKSKLEIKVERDLKYLTTRIELQQSLKEHKFKVKYVSPFSKDELKKISKPMALKRLDAEVVKNLPYYKESNIKLSKIIDTECQNDGELLVILLGYYHFPVADHIKKTGHNHVGSFMVLQHDKLETFLLPLFGQISEKDEKRVTTDFHILNGVPNLKFIDHKQNPEINAVLEVQDHIERALVSNTSDDYNANKHDEL